MSRAREFQVSRRKDRRWVKVGTLLASSQAVALREARGYWTSGALTANELKHGGAGVGGRMVSKAEARRLRRRAVPGPPGVSAWEAENRRLLKLPAIYGYRVTLTDPARAKAVAYGLRELGAMQVRQADAVVTFRSGADLVGRRGPPHTLLRDAIGAWGGVVERRKPRTVRAPPAAHPRGGRTDIKSILFLKTMWTRRALVAWLREHDKRHDQIEAGGGKYWHAVQRESSAHGASKPRYRMIAFGDFATHGIKAIVEVHGRKRA